MKSYGEVKPILSESKERKSPKSSSLSILELNTYLKIRSN